MKGWLNWFKNPTVLALIGLLALALVIWFGADYVRFGKEAKPLSEVGRLLLILLLVVLWGLNNLRVRAQQSKANDDLVEGINAPAADVTPDTEQTQQEAELLRQRFTDALAQLKKTRFHTRRGNKALYELPWYIIIGPPGAGKTTALINSGLEFPLQGADKQALGGIGGTRNCDWWFTNEAVLIDTAGRYTTQDSHKTVDRSAWHSFLQLLRKYRKRRPINGAIIAISIQDVLTQSEAELTLHATTIRDRINELQEELGIRFPIYLTFTKCDLLAGFSEFFENLSQAEREQVWGVTFPANASQQGAEADYFVGEFDALAARLNERVLWRVNQERDLGRRNAIQLFPQQFGNLRNNIHQLVKGIFSDSRYHTPPLLRGIYFTSATQQGSPIDRVMASVASSFGFGQEVAQPAAGQGKSFFLSRLLNDVVFAESDMVGTNQRYERRLRLARRLAFAGLGLVLLVSTLLWAGSFVRQQNLMADVETHLATYRSERQRVNTWDKSPLKALPTLNALQQANAVYAQLQHPWLSGFGLYDANVEKAAQSAYETELNQLFLPRFAFELEQLLATANADDPRLFETLRLYLMLAMPERRENQAVMQWAEQHWSRALSGQAEVQTELLNHLQALLAYDFPAYDSKRTVLARAQNLLRQTPIEQRIYHAIKTSAFDGQQVDLTDELGGGVAELFQFDNATGLQTPVLFTKAGYEQLDFDADAPAVRYLTENRWVLGQGSETESFSDADLERIGATVKALYLKDYESHWMALLDGMKLKPFSNLAQASEAASRLADPVYSPLTTLLNLVARNTQLTPELSLLQDEGDGANPLANLAPESLKPTSVDKAFKPLQRFVKPAKQGPAPLDDYMKRIADLDQYLKQIAQAPNAGEAAYKAAAQRYAGATTDTLRRLNNLGSEVPEAMRNWSATLADESWKVMLGRAKGHVNQLWRDQVYQEFQRSLAGKYPLNRGVDDEASLRDFNRFFKADGVLQGFFDERLKPFINTGRRWSNKSLDGRSLGFSNEALANLRKATAIRDTLFAQNPASASFNFALKPLKLDSSVSLFELELGTRRLRYSHGPQIKKDASWPLEGRDRIRLVFETLNGQTATRQFEGDWSLFRMLDASNLRTTPRDTRFHVSFQADARVAEYELLADSSLSPFNADLLTAYRCPEQL